MSDTVNGPLFGLEAARLGRDIVEQSIARDVALVRDRLAAVWTDPVIGVWLTSANAHLDGARPCDALALNERDAVMDAVRMEVVGGTR